MDQQRRVSRLVLPDSKALSLFENDASIKIIEKRRELPGYELYVVEQWATSRTHLTSLITTFTGLTHHRIKVYVLEIPAEEKGWSDRLRTYIQNISKAPARRKDTPLGMLMVTNLSSFASTLTVLNIPGGEFDEHRDIFVVNENLKRLGCSGRAGLNLSEPSGAAQAKFRQLYHTSDAIPITEAAIELVRVCQKALVLYAQLDREYTDGLLCDVTIEAVKDWWAQIGSEHFDTEPTDGVLGPITVAALLGLLQGARVRLQSLNAPIGKDVFDLRSTKRAIEAFQKWYKLDKTRRLDPRTLDKLHTLTSKYANSKEWMVPRAVKSTIPQLGKGGEMVMGMVSNKDRASIGEIEAGDLNTFASTASGDTARRLWQGKNKKTTVEGSHSRHSSDEDPFSADDTPLKHQRKRDVVLDRLPTLSTRGDHFYNNLAGSQISLDPSDRDQSMHKHVFKSVTDRIGDAKSGLGKFRDAVGISGFRGHTSRSSKDQTVFGNEPFIKSGMDETRSVSGGTSKTTSHPGLVSKDQSKSPNHAGQQVSPPALRLKPGQALQSENVTGEQLVFTPSEISPDDKQLRKPVSISPLASPTDIKSTTLGPPQTLIRSASHDQSMHQHQFTPRHRTLSYGEISDALGSEARPKSIRIEGDLTSQLAENVYLTELTLGMKQQLDVLEKNVLPQAKQRVRETTAADSRLAKELEDIEKQYLNLLDDHDNQQQETGSTLLTVRTNLDETIARIEGVMAKLEYELNMLASKVEDVEDGVADFEEQVVSLETRAEALKPDEKASSSWPWRMASAIFGLS